jgi:hypothetical protein
MANQLLQAPIPRVQGSKALLGPDIQWETMLIVPVTGDTYPANGYVITAVACGFKMIQGAIVTGGNATAFPASGGWYAQPIFPETQLATNSQGFTGYSQFLLKVYVASTGAEYSGVLNALVGNVWQVLVIGY